MNKTVVFLGSREKISYLFPYEHFFMVRRWQIHECNSVSAVQKLDNIDIIIVWSFADDYIKEVDQWTNHPPILWCCTCNEDQAPKNVKTASYGLLPGELYLLAVSTCRQQE